MAKIKRIGYMEEETMPVKSNWMVHGQEKNLGSDLFLSYYNLVQSVLRSDYC